ncbi:hypothetical protein HOB10_00500 [Candidatus Parcubacteria bacterium]|jgi:hypothetical protein|nr:hypothetical protein [Candidatus Parcubacteria bacterium]
MKVITTIPPYAPFIGRVAELPIISGVRLNTVMPVQGVKEDDLPSVEALTAMLKLIKSQIGDKDMWIDLKCRQVRVSHGFFFNGSDRPPKAYQLGDEVVVLDSSRPKAHGILRTPPWATLKIDHKIKLDTSKGPVKCWFQDGYDSAHIVDVIDGDTLIMLEGPKKVVGGGESINIIHPSFEVEGYFTELDRRYIEAAVKLGIHTFMLSYVEQDSDIQEMLALDPKAVIKAKIESPQGFDWACKCLRKFPGVGLMAARGDMYVEFGRPDKILRPLRKIAEMDSDAIVASRILTSLRHSPRPTCSDIMDIQCLLQMGYGHIMVGDDICFDEDTLMLALDILSAIERG